VSFLSQNEINSMKKDMDNLLESPESQTVIFRWQTGHTGTWDDQYKRYVGGAPVYTTNDGIKCIVAFLTESNIETLIDAGIDVKIGDAIFYFEYDTDLSGKEALRITHKGIYWYPIVPQPAPFEISGVPLGASQMATILYCTRIRRSETTDEAGGGITI